MAKDLKISALPLKKTEELNGNEIIPLAENGQNSAVTIKDLLGKVETSEKPEIPGNATTEQDGLMSAEDKAQIDGFFSEGDISVLDNDFEFGEMQESTSPETPASIEVKLPISQYSTRQKEWRDDFSVGGKIKIPYASSSKDGLINKDDYDMLHGLDGRINALELGSGQNTYCVAAWDTDTLNPDAIEIYGDKSILEKWEFYLFDVTAKANEDGTLTPVGKLKRNNLLRFDDNTFAPTVGITETMRAMCDTALYLDAQAIQLYCEAGTFDAKMFYEEYGMNTPLYDADGNQIEHILRPWETTSQNYSIFFGREDDVYLLDNVVGKSGKTWRGIFTKPMVWDGIDVTPYKLAATAIAPCPITTIGNKPRTFFFTYDAGDANCKSSNGQNNIVTMFRNERTYPRVNDSQQVNCMKWARSLNTDPQSPIPFAEGGYHALNTFLTAMEVLHETKYLHKADRFGSGISSNDTCNNESTWLANGGIRYRADGASTWNYNTIASQGNIYYNADGARTTFSILLNQEYPKEQTMESQMAYSFAQEIGVNADEKFNFYGSEYTYKDVPNATAGRMNVRVYKVMAQSVNAFNVAGDPTVWEIEVNLRMSLYAGLNGSGDIYAYWGGGSEFVGTCLSATKELNNPVIIYLETDQSKWLYETNVNKNDLGVFDFESSYDKIGETVNLADGYMSKRIPYSGYKLANGGNIGTGECAYGYTRTEWSTTINQRVRLSVRFRGIAPTGLCSVRYLTASNAASGPTRTSGCSAQVRFKPRGKRSMVQPQ